MAEYQKSLKIMTTDQILRANDLIHQDNRRLSSEITRSVVETVSLMKSTKENMKKIKRYKKLPHVVATVVEILEMEDEEEDARNFDDARRKRKFVLLRALIKTLFLPEPGLVDPEELKLGDLVAIKMRSSQILYTLPHHPDPQVSAMVLDEKPTDDFCDIGGLETQIKDLVEAIVMPITHKHLFQKIGIRPPKGVLLYGPPGTGKTMMARACATETNATFMRLAGTQLVKQGVGDGAKLLREAFKLAKEKSPCIIFIDEIDSIGRNRLASYERYGAKEVQRTLLELLNQLDGFSREDSIKVIAATNRPDILDPALLRAGRLDRKLELPHPNEAARGLILQIHSRNMNVHPDVHYKELASSIEDFNGAQLKAVCVEAGMIALRRDDTEVKHEDFNAAIREVQAKKTKSYNYYA